MAHGYSLPSPPLPPSLPALNTSHLSVHIREITSYFLCVLGMGWSAWKGLSRQVQLGGRCKDFILLSPFLASVGTWRRVSSGAGVCVRNPPTLPFLLHHPQPPTTTPLRLLSPHQAIATGTRVGIPMGRLLRGTRENKGHKWHLEQVALVEMATEVCHGRPSDVDSDLGYWVDNVRYFCPWAVVPIRLRWV